MYMYLFNFHGGPCPRFTTADFMGIRAVPGLQGQIAGTECEECNPACASRDVHIHLSPRSRPLPAAPAINSFSSGLAQLYLSWRKAGSWYSRNGPNPAGRRMRRETTREGRGVIGIGRTKTGIVGRRTGKRVGTGTRTRMRVRRCWVTGLAVLYTSLSPSSRWLMRRQHSRMLVLPPGRRYCHRLHPHRLLGSRHAGNLQGILGEQAKAESVQGTWADYARNVNVLNLAIFPPWLGHWITGLKQDSGFVNGDLC